MSEKKAPVAKARIDASGTATPKTKLVAKVRPGVCFGPGCTPESWELRDNAVLDEVDPAKPEVADAEGIPRKG